MPIPFLIKINNPHDLSGLPRRTALFLHDYLRIVRWIAIILLPIWVATLLGHLAHAQESYAASTQHFAAVFDGALSSAVISICITTLPFVFGLFAVFTILFYPRKSASIRSTQRGLFIFGFSLLICESMQWGLSHGFSDHLTSYMFGSAIVFATCPLTRRCTAFLLVFFIAFPLSLAFMTGIDANNFATMIAKSSLPLATMLMAITHLRWQKGNFNSHRLDHLRLQRSEQTLTRKNEELVIARDTADMASKSKMEFTASVSHEIRTPMSAIIGFSEIIQKDKELPEKFLPDISIISDSARSLLQIINDILDFTKHDSMQVSLEHIPFNLKGMVYSIKQMFTHELSQKNIDLIVQYHGEESSHFVGDPTKLRQVIQNLISNAIKFSDTGDVIFSVQCSPAGEGIHFVVSDSGIGMSASQLKHIFDPYTQAEQSISRQYGGTGLGTTICKRIIDLMQGDIWINSALGEGTSAHFTVDLLPFDGQGPCLYDPNYHKNSERLPSLSRHILVAEDVVINALLLQRKLTEFGHTVDIAINGQQALELYQKRHYDLILMDVQMPILDGISATREIRRLEEGRSKPIPVIAVTAHYSESVNAKCLTDGMDDVVAKPIDFDKLEPLIDGLLGITSSSIGSPSQEQTSEDTFIEQLAFFSDIADLNAAFHFWQDPVFYLQMVTDFFQLYCDNENQLPLSLPSDESALSAAKNIAHMLKGTAGILRLDPLYEALRELDKCLVEESFEEYQTLRRNLSNHSGPLQQALEVHTQRTG
ncbi:MAG: ATP-binding protein [Motiliproteus sp.]